MDTIVVEILISHISKHGPLISVQQWHVELHASVVYLILLMPLCCCCDIIYTINYLRHSIAYQDI